MIARRQLLRVLGFAVAARVAPRTTAAHAQGIELPASDVDTTNLFVMNQAAALAVRLPPKPGARPSMTTAARDDLERRLRCPCGCTHDLFVCWTTDFECAVAPRLHEDVVALVAGGYDAGEIEDEFVRVFGEGIRVVPRAEGISLLGWSVPFAGYVVALVYGARAAWRVRRDAEHDVETP